MPKGPKGERRPADLNKRAFAIVQIATGEADEPARSQPARKAGKAGGKARASKLSSNQRSEIARKGALSRWKSMKNRKSIKED